MKKALIIALSAAILLIATACSNNTDELMMLSSQLTEMQIKLQTLEDKIDELTVLVENNNAAAALPQENQNVPSAEQPVERPSAIPVPDLSDIPSLVLNTLIEYKTTAAYIKKAIDPETISVTHAMRYQLGDLEGMPIDVVLIQLADIDTNIYGVNADALLINLADNTIYDDSTLDLNNCDVWADPTMETAFSYLLNAYYSYLTFGENIMNDFETRTELSIDELSIINAELAK